MTLDQALAQSQNPTRLMTWVKILCRDGGKLIYMNTSQLWENIPGPWIDQAVKAVELESYGIQVQWMESKKDQP